MWARGVLRWEKRWKQSRSGEFSGDEKRWVHRRVLWRQDESDVACWEGRLARVGIKDPKTRKKFACFGLDDPCGEQRREHPLYPDTLSNILFGLGIISGRGINEGRFLCSLGMVSQDSLSALGGLPETVLLC